MDNPRPEKVAVVDEVRERLDGVQRRRSSPSTGASPSPSSPTCAGALAGGRRRLQGLQEHPGRAGDRRRPPRGARPPARRARRRSPSSPARSAPWPRPCGTTPGPTPADREGRAPRRADSCRPRRSAPWPTCRPATSSWPGSPGAIAAPLQQFAGLLQALPRNFAYGLSALLDQQGGAPRSRRPPAADAPAEAEAEATPAAEADGGEPTAPRPSAEAPAAEAQPPRLQPPRPEPRQQRRTATPRPPSRQRRRVLRRRPREWRRT